MHNIFSTPPRVFVDVLSLLAYDQSWKDCEKFV